MLVIVVAGADPGGRSLCSPKAPSIFFTKVILHRRVLFYKCTDITAPKIPCQCLSQTKIVDPPLRRSGS